MDKNNQFFIFSDSITHSSVKSNDLDEIVGAGFCTIAIGYITSPCEVRQKGGECDVCPVEEKVVNAHCFGESVSLGIKSREIDEAIINNKINNPYA